MEQEFQIQMYKDDIPLTKEQEEMLKILREAGKPTITVLRAFLAENYTDEFKQRLALGKVEGVGMDLDED